jgi:hypothetical protein
MLPQFRPRIPGPGYDETARARDTGGFEADLPAGAGAVADQKLTRRPTITLCEP